MKKVYLSIVLIIISFLFNSCFQVIEEIDLLENGSGKMTITLNLSQSKAKVASILKMKTVNGRAVPSETEIKSKVNKAAQTIRQINGISNVKTSTDFSNYIAVISFNFADISNLNSVSKKIFSEYDIKAANAATYTYNRAGKVFSKKYIHSPETRKAYNGLSAADKQIFENATYTSIYRFRNTVGSQSNAVAKVSKSGKAVMQQSSVLNIIHAKTNLSNTIKLK